MKMDILIKNGAILTMDEKGSTIPNGYLAVRGDVIASLGEGNGGEIRASKTIDARGGLVLPGLINGHTHAAMTLFRGLADDLPLMEWLSQYIFPAESRMDPDLCTPGVFWPARR